MRRRILVVLLAFGTVAGFTSGFLNHRRYSREWQRHVADVCVDAARRGQLDVPKDTATKSPR